MYGLSTKTNGSCKEVAVVESLKQDSVYGLSAKKKMAIVEKWPLVAIVERWSLVEVRLYSEIVAGV